MKINLKTIKYFNAIQGWKIETDNDGINQENQAEDTNQDSGEDLPF